VSAPPDQLYSTECIGSGYWECLRRPWCETDSKWGLGIPSPWGAHAERHIRCLYESERVYTSCNIPPHDAYMAHCLLYRECLLWARTFFFCIIMTWNFIYIYKLLVLLLICSWWLPKGQEVTISFFIYNRDERVRKREGYCLDMTNDRMLSSVAMYSSSSWLLQGVMKGKIIYITL
jgi:hypothetical protein